MRNSLLDKKLNKTLEKIENHYKEFDDMSFENFIIYEDPKFLPKEQKVCDEKAKHCKSPEAMTKTIIDQIKIRTGVMNPNKLKSTVILVLDLEFVVAKDAIKIPF